MLALSFGLLAALVWAVHDLLVRRLSQGMEILPMLAVVLAAGSAGLALPALVLGGWDQLTARGLWFCGAAGIAYTVATVGLYKAFQIAPVRIVAPVLGAYPMFSLGAAMAQGKVVSVTEWLAVLGIVVGIAVVALTSKHTANAVRVPLAQALIWAFLGSVGFAATFALGQTAARQGAELLTILVTRLIALLGVAMLMIALRSDLRSVRPHFPLLGLMGLFDALALGLVMVAGDLPHPEYAAITSSLFGVFTIILAWRFLREAVLPLQWLGIAVVFAGIAGLAAQG